MTRELYDDFKRFLRDREVNSQKFTKLTTRGVPLSHALSFSFFIILCISPLGPETVKSKDIQVSDIIILEKVQSVNGWEGGEGGQQRAFMETF